MTTHGRSTVKKLKVHFQIKRGPKSKHANTRRNSSTVRGLFTLLTLTHCSLFAIRYSLFVIHHSHQSDSESNFVSITTGVQIEGGAAGGCRAGFGIFWRMTAPEGVRRPELRCYWNCNCNCDYFTLAPVPRCTVGQVYEIDADFCFIVYNATFFHY